MATMPISPRLKFKKRPTTGGKLPQGKVPKWMILVCALVNFGLGIAEQFYFHRPDWAALLVGFSIGNIIIWKMTK